MQTDGTECTIGLIGAVRRACLVCLGGNPDTTLWKSAPLSRDPVHPGAHRDVDSLRPPLPRADPLFREGRSSDSTAPDWNEPSGDSESARVRVTYRHILGLQLAEPRSRYGIATDRASIFCRRLSRLSNLAASISAQHIATLGHKIDIPRNKS